MRILFALLLLSATPVVTLADGYYTPTFGTASDGSVMSSNQPITSATPPPVNIYGRIMVCREKGGDIQSAEPVLEHHKFKLTECVPVSQCRDYFQGSLRYVCEHPESVEGCYVFGTIETLKSAVIQPGQQCIIVNAGANRQSYQEIEKHMTDTLPSEDVPSYTAKIVDGFLPY